LVCVVTVVVLELFKLVKLVELVVDHHGGTRFSISPMNEGLLLVVSILAAAFAQIDLTSAFAQIDHHGGTQFSNAPLTLELNPHRYQLHRTCV
jgi:hypothetical protein